ncbi:MAG: DegT/DnrJ/EryC1/StrS family aminotransferase [Vicinamibacterales bacterium]
MPIIETRSLVAAMRVLLKGGLARYATKGVSEVTHLEQDLGEKIGSRWVLGVNSGTSGLICALVGVGIGPGDEVLVPAYTWVSSAAAVLAVGAVPVLVEIDQSLTLDPVDLRRKITPYTKAIIPVHMLNLVCDMEAIQKVAAEHGLKIVEDACQAVGVTWRGQRCGSLGDAGVFSFQQNKNIQSGEGGAVFTNDERIYARARMYHDVGSYIRSDRVKTDEPLFVGVNYRMPELAAAILRPQLKRLDRKLDLMRRRRSEVLEQLAKSKTFRFHVCPHHDASSAVGLAVYFDDIEMAKEFAKATGVNRLIDTGRHVYTNWESLRGKVAQHPRLDPFAWANRPIDYPANSCPQTLDILERTCTINLLPDLPSSAYRMAVKRMVR